MNVILANTGTVVCFRTASPIDEELMLSQFAPYVEKGNIGNLPRFRFYMKLSAVTPEEPFSGQTLPMSIEHDQERRMSLIEASRKNYGHRYQKMAASKSVTGKKGTKKKTSHEANHDDISTLG